jgi:thiol-disulfide isomerase/thioredoxin
MGKAERNRRESAREKIAAQQAAARRAQVRRQVLLTAGSVAAVLVVVVAFIVINSFRHSSVAAAKSVATAEKQITSVPASTLNSVGKGTATTMFPVTGAPPLTSQGKPEMLYMGAEYCPYCAAERWAMTVALSRFGTFSNLHFIHSSSTDVYANTPTLTFYKSSYTSKYLTFVPVEWYSGVPDSKSPTGYKVLQTPTAAQQALFSKYNATPYVPSADAGAFPFVGSQYVPTGFAGMTWAQIAAAAKDPNSAVAKDIDGAANSITAAICKMTNNQPANVCSSSAAQAGAGAL